jgi:hypothetical protein
MLHVEVWYIDAFGDEQLAMYDIRGWDMESAYRFFAPVWPE